MQQKRSLELLGINNTRGDFDMRVFNGWRKLDFLLSINPLKNITAKY